MKVPFVHGPNDLRVDEIPVPVAGARDVLVKPAVVGICGSDIGYVAAGGVGTPSDVPIPLGHELSAIVEMVGSEVSGFAPGDRVIVNPYLNYIGNGGSEGGFAERLRVRDVAGQPGSLVAMPDGMALEAGALVEPLAVALHAVNRSEVKPGHRVALFGAGPIGLAMVALMRRLGIDDIVVFDPAALRRERALQMGARAALDPQEGDPADRLAELHGATTAHGAKVVGTDAFIDAAGASGIVQMVLAMARIGAGLTIVAVPKDPAAVPIHLLLGKELTVRGSLGYPDEFGTALQLLAEGFDLSPIITHRFAGGEIEQAFATASKPQDAIKVLVDYAS